MHSRSQYQLTAWTRRPNPYSQCLFTLLADGQLVGSSDIYEASDDWIQTTVTQYFTATASTQVKIEIHGGCSGGASSNNKIIHMMFPSMPYM